MKKYSLSIIALFILASSFSQTTSQNLEKAFREFESDEQMKNGISSLYVIDAATGKVVFDKNSRLGLAPASTQKIITSATAFELLGTDFKYKTDFWRYKLGRSTGLFVQASGDPTLGSWRYKNATDSFIISNIKKGLSQNNIPRSTCSVRYNWQDFSQVAIPGGWIWEDIGNYYGAAAGILNWKENQEEIVLSSGSKVGSPVKILSPDSSHFHNQLKSAAAGTGDNAYVYFAAGSFTGRRIINGTIPINEPAFKISASITDPASAFAYDICWTLSPKDNNGENIRVVFAGSPFITDIDTIRDKIRLYTHYSPSLDSIIYWFNRRSINLYGEALVKTFAYEKQGYGSTDSGVALLRRFWKEKGIDENELNMYDGSGLSPLNRVTTHAQVEILKYAKSRTWFNAFYESLPEYNGMKMKSGTITDVKGFCGYHKAKDGREYIYSFLVNNYSGRASAIVAKMYKVLDLLK